MGKSNTLEAALINATLRGIAFPTITTAYVALYSEDPTDAGTGAEFPDEIGEDPTGYARVAVTCNTGNWTAPADDGGPQVTLNDEPIVFPDPILDWGTYTHWGIHSHATNNALLIHGPISVPREVKAGDVAPTFAVGALSWSES